MTSQKDSASGTSNGRLNRRHLLKGTGAAVGGLAFPFGQTVSALNDGYNGEKVTRTPSPQNSLTPSEVFEIQREMVQKFRSKTGFGEEIPLGVVYPSEDSEILSLSFRIDGAGQPSVFVGTAPSDQSVSKGRAGRLHRAAREHAEKVQGEVAPKLTDRDVTSGGASADSVTGWDEMVSEYAIQHDDCPYGSLFLGGEVYEKKGTSFYGYGVDHVHRSNPGSNYCGSSWSLNDAHSYHNWDAFDRDEPILHEYHPDSNQSGNFSVSGSVGYSGASISVNYAPPDVFRTVTAGSNGTENVEWDWDYTFDPDSPAQHEPASIIKSPEEAVSSPTASNRLLEIVGGATWIDLLQGNENTSTSPYIYVE